MAKLQLNPAQQEKVKKALVTAATGPAGSTMGQAGKVAQTFGLPAFEGEKMPAGGMLLEGGITRKPQTKPSTVSLPDIIRIGDRAFQLDDLVAQGRVLKQKYGENSPMAKLYNNLISGKEIKTETKFDQRKNPESSVDTLQNEAVLYSPFTDVNKRGNVKREGKGSTTNEMGIVVTKEGKTRGTNISDYGFSSGIMNELKDFLIGRGIKPTRSLANEREKGYSRMD